MNHNVTNRTEQYHCQFQQAHTDAERQRLVADYKTYYAQLSAIDKAVADKLHDEHFAETEQKVKEMEPVLQRAKEMLNHHLKVTGRTTESADRQ